MIYNWFKIFNLAEFDAAGLVSRTYTLDFDGIGQKKILATKGNTTAITYEGVMLTVGAIDEIFEFDGFASYQTANQDVYLGIPNET